MRNKLFPIRVHKTVEITHAIYQRLFKRGLYLCKEYVKGKVNSCAYYVQRFLHQIRIMREKSYLCKGYWNPQRKMAFFFEIHVIILESQQYLNSCAHLECNHPLRDAQSVCAVKAMLHEAIFLASCNATNVALQIARKNSRVTLHFATTIVALRVARKVERSSTFRNVAR